MAGASTPSRRYVVPDSWMVLPSLTTRSADHAGVKDSNTIGLSGTLASTAIDAPAIDLPQ